MKMTRPAFFFGLILSLTGILVFSSCVKEANLDIDFKPSLVVFSTIAPYYLNLDKYASPTYKQPKVTVQVGETKTPSDDSDFVSLSNAEVEVRGRTRSGPNTIDYNSKCDCFPGDKLDVLQGNIYSLKAFAPGFDTVYAETTIPKATKASNGFIKDFKMDYSIKNAEKINFSYSLTFRLDHDPEAEYYHIIFHHDFDNVDPNSNSKGYFYTLNPIYSDGFAYTTHYNQGILIKRTDLSSRTISFNFSDFTYDYEPLLGVIVEVRTVNEDYFRYHESISRQRIVRQDPFAEPVTIHNNIQNGFGNFSGYNLEVLSIPLEN